MEAYREFRERKSKEIREKKPEIVRGIKDVFDRNNLDKINLASIDWVGRYPMVNMYQSLDSIEYDRSKDILVFNASDESDNDVYTENDLSAEVLVEILYCILINEYNTLEVVEDEDEDEDY